MGEPESPILAKLSGYRHHSANYAASILRKNGTLPNGSSINPEPSADKCTKSQENEILNEFDAKHSKSSPDENRVSSSVIDLLDNDEDMAPALKQKQKMKAIILSDSDEEGPAEDQKKARPNRKRIRISSESSNPESPPWISKSQPSSSACLEGESKPKLTKSESLAALRKIRQQRKQSKFFIDSDEEEKDSSSKLKNEDLWSGSNTKEQLALLRKQRLTEEEEEEEGSEGDVEEVEEIIDLDMERQISEAPSIPKKLSKSELKEQCLKFFNEGPADDLMNVSRCNSKMVEIILAKRPFANYDVMVEDFDETKGLSACVVEDYKDSLEAKVNLERLLTDCSRRSFHLQEAVQSIKTGTEGMKQIQTPKLLATGLELKPYQKIGLNWLALMHEKRMNAVLADEMGLGKTIQVIAFLAHLRDTQKQRNPHLIVVPSSTIDNWSYELKRWWPSVKVVNYYGSQLDRATIRHQMLRGRCRDQSVDVLLTTYQMLQSKAEDRSFFRKCHINYVVYDEAHMLKNFTTKRYQTLMKVRSTRKLLLTGTPMQNNLVELMSLMYFVMPEIFKDFQDDMGQILSQFQQKNGASSGGYDQEKIDQAKKIMMPFVLRRLKSEVLSQLPAKSEVITTCSLTTAQREIYDGIADNYRRLAEEGIKGNKGMKALMELRKAANHPLLLRRIYNNNKLRVMSKNICKEIKYRESNPELVFEDMEVMSDFELNRLCQENRTLTEFRIPEASICDSGKCIELDKLLKKFKAKGEKVLLFSQFVMVLDILEVYLKCREYKYSRLDGQTSVVERQGLINSFNSDPELFVFLLSTRAGGLGINLTSASVIILHDIDFNPHNDRQAEDRCHRVGQTKDVTVIKMISENTVEEYMLACAKKKLELESQLTGNGGAQKTEDCDREEDNQSVESLLRKALCL